MKFRFYKNSRRGFAPAVVAISLVGTVVGFYIGLAAFFSLAVFDVPVWGGVVLYLSAYASFGLSFVVAFPRRSARNTVTSPLRSFPVRFDYLMLVISLFAVFLVFYDRYALRGIDYFSLGMAQARAAINSAGSSGSIFSVAGNFFAYLYLLPFVSLILMWEEKSRSYKFLVSLGVLGVVGGLSYLMGGRTVVLITLSVLFSALFGRALVKKKFIPAGIGLMGVVMLVSSAIVFFGAVFYLRSRAFGVGSSAEYVESLCSHLFSFDSNLRGTCAVERTSGFSGDIWNYFLAILMYAFHCMWVAQSVFEGLLHAPGSSVLLSGFSSLFLERLGLVIPEHSYAGYFVPAPAAVFYDLGWLGVFVIFATTGFFFRIVTANFIHGRLWFGQIAFVFMLSSLILSVMISPANLPGFVIWFLSMVFVYLGVVLIKNVLVTAVR